MQAVSSSTDRDQLWDDFVRERVRQEREAERAERRRRAEAFRTQLRETPSIQATTSWRKAQPMLEGGEGYEGLGKPERVDVFAEHIR